MYITALYWSCVCTNGVGYGDIIPKNNYEKGFVCIIFVVGISILSYA